jgi:hypothetical protein
VLGDEVEADVVLKFPVGSIISDYIIEKGQNYLISSGQKILVKQAQISVYGTLTIETGACLEFYGEDSGIYVYGGKLIVEGKEKASILTRLHYKLSEIAPLLKDECKISNSYLISLDKTAPFQLLKRIYGLPLEPDRAPGHWRYNNLLLIPISLENDNIIGFIILDDPADKQTPSGETVYILEKIAKMVAVTIQNKTVFLKLNSKIQQLEADNNSLNSNNGSSNRIKNIFRRMSPS